MSAASSPAAESVLVVEDLSKRFGDRVAVSEVSFSLEAGEVFGFLGPNGAGKTTTVRTLATLIEPTSGAAVVAGIPLRPENAGEIRRRISVMPENPGLYLRLTVEENLRFFAGLYSLREPQGRVARALELVNLTGRAKDLCGSLSKGCVSGSGSRGRCSTTRSSSSSTSRPPVSTRWRLMRYTS